MDSSVSRRKVSSGPLRPRKTHILFALIVLALSIYTGVIPDSEVVSQVALSVAKLVLGVGQ